MVILRTSVALQCMPIHGISGNNVLSIESHHVAYCKSLENLYRCYTFKDFFALSSKGGVKSQTSFPHMKVEAAGHLLQASAVVARSMNLTWKTMTAASPP